jgi:hypothetical protein
MQRCANVVSATTLGGHCDPFMRPFKATTEEGEENTTHQHRWTVHEPLAVGGVEAVHRWNEHDH